MLAYEENKNEYLRGNLQFLSAYQLTCESFSPNSRANRTLSDLEMYFCTWRERDKVISTLVQSQLSHWGGEIGSE